MKSSRRKTAVIVSVVVHVMIVVALYLWYVPRHQGESTNPSIASEKSAMESFESPTPAAPPPSPEPEIENEQIEASMKSQLDAVEKLPEEKKRSELVKNLKRLESITDDQSVIQTSNRIAAAMGLDTTQYAPKPDDPSSPSDSADAISRFDPDTAQVSDVLRTKTESGKWQYRSVMVDAQGQKITVPLSSADGESVYQTFQTMKQFPMADGIYRSVVMPLMQKMIEAERLAHKAEQAARQIEADNRAASSE